MLKHLALARLTTRRRRRRRARARSPIYDDNVLAYVNKRRRVEEVEVWRAMVAKGKGEESYKERRRGEQEERDARELERLCKADFARQVR